MDEALPPKGERAIDKALADKVFIAVTMAAKRCAIARKAVLEKRKGGEEGRFLRGWSIWYTRGLGAAVWQTALIWGLDRKQIGQEESAFIDMLARNSELADEAETLTRMCDEAIRFNPAAFLRAGLSERLADAAAKKSIKTVRAASNRLELAPALKPKTEAENIQAKLQAKRRQQARDQAERILNRVIEAGAAPNATKEQRRDKQKAELALQELQAGAKLARVGLG